MTLEEIQKDVDNKQSLTTEQNYFLFQYLDNLGSSKEQKRIKELIWKGNIGIVKDFLKRYQSFQNINELEQEANLALGAAIRNYDYKQGYTFFTYAYRSILNNINHFLKKKDSIFKEQQIVDDTNSFKNNKVVQVISLNGKINADSEEKCCELLESIPDNYNLEEESIYRYYAKVIREEIETLPKIYRMILKDRYGCDVERKLTIKECSKKYGFSESKITRMEKKALGMLRARRKIQKLRWKD